MRQRVDTWIGQAFEMFNQTELEMRVLHPRSFIQYFQKYNAKMAHSENILDASALTAYVQSAAAPLGRGAHLRLAGPLSPAQSRLRTPSQDRRNDGLSGHDSSHARPARKGLNSFSNRLLHRIELKSRLARTVAGRSFSPRLGLRKIPLAMPRSPHHSLRAFQWPHFFPPGVTFGGDNSGQNAEGDPPPILITLATRNLPCRKLGNGFQFACRQCL